MQPARAPFATFLAAQIAISPPMLPVHANLDGAPYSQDPMQIRDLSLIHISEPTRPY